jgi:hypothetical protein
LPLSHLENKTDRPLSISTAIEKLIRARDKAFKKRCKFWKVLRALVQRSIRGSKRALIRNKLNENQKTIEWCSKFKSVIDPKETNRADRLSTTEASVMRTSLFCGKLNHLFEYWSMTCIHSL